MFGPVTPVRPNLNTSGSESVQTLYTPDQTDLGHGDLGVSPVPLALRLARRLVRGVVRVSANGPVRLSVPLPVPISLGGFTDSARA